MINSDYLDNLNKAQKEAVLHLDGPLLIVAGAGSGKTKVLTSRIAHIIKEKKAFPNQILSVTFTNKAAKEMQNRVSKILGSAAIGLSWLGTFHSICAKLLRKHAPAVGLTPAVPDPIPPIKLSDTLYGIEEYTLSDEIEPKTSSVVRGEELIELLNLMVQFLIGHVHPFHGMVPDGTSTNGVTMDKLQKELRDANQKILNKYIRIN